MVSPKIKSAIEADVRLAEDLNSNGFVSDWKKFNRTTFEFIARRINKIVSSKIANSPFLVTEKLIIGQDYLSKMLFEKKAKDEESLIHMIANLKRPFNWISGKTLQSYWNGGKAKETKINVLLVFLGVEISEWDKWKDARKNSPLSFSGRTNRKPGKQDVLINYFLGNYFLYYQKTDGSDTLIKAPFIIEKDDNDQVIVQTITEGHLYKSTLIELREGILYIHCENQFFNDKENHIFNVGNETNPEVIFGISNTITVKSKLAIGIRNVLIKQRKEFSSMLFEEKEINLSEDTKLDAEENLVRSYFLKQKTNIMTSHTCCTIDVLKKMTKESN
jgi:hypothetical protein